ncbi:hypothetical protein [Bacillus infantis]|uniref:hypothetical protein n=1 Tax=Bacillus infantis TaxID=324767 RepID=UPI003CF412FC
MELFRLFGTIAIDNTNANNAINETSEEAEDAEKKVSNAFEKIGGVAGTIAKGIGVAGAAIGGAFIAAIEGTREYRQEMGKLDTAFITNGHSSQVAKQTYSDLNAVLGETDQAVEAANHLAVLTDNEADLQKWTDICTGVYATFGASLPIEGLTEAANETAKVGQVTGAVADALNWAGISEDEFNDKLAKCSTEQERQKLIMETLNSTYSDASKQYKETNEDILESRKAQERLSDAMAEVGAVGEPVMTAIKNGIADMAEIAVPKIQEVIEKIQDGITWVKENEETVKIWLGVIAIATATLAGFVLVLTWSTIMKKAAQALEIVTVAMKALNAAMKANVIGLIVVAIMGLVAAFIYLWNNCESFRNFWIELWEIIKNAASVAWEAIKNAWSGIGTWFTEKFEVIKNAGQTAMDNVKQFFIGAWNSIKGVWNGVKSYFSSVWSGIKDIFNSVATWFGDRFKNAWNNIKSAFSNWGSFFSELWGKVKNKFGDIGTKIGTAINSAITGAMNKALGKIESSINKGIRLINKAIGLANKLGFNVGKVGEISLPRLARGAVVTQATTALIGEDGAEAVVPLEKNTQWIDKLATQLDSKMGNVSNSILIERINRVISLLEQMISRNIYLDSGVLVGELASGIDARLGERYKHIQRGNTR